MDTKTNQAGWLLLAVAILQPFCGGFAPLTGLGTPIGTASRLTGGPEQPLPVFFSIWSIIFLGFLIFALMTLRAREPWMNRVALPLALAGLFNCLWMLSAQLIVQPILDHILLVPILLAAFASAHAFDRLRGLDVSPAKRVADATTGLLSGWLTTAFAISAPLSVRALTDIGPTDRVWLMLWLALAIAGLGAYIFTRFISRSLWFYVALLWGLAGIVLNNLLVLQTHLLGIVTAFIALILITMRLTRGANGSQRSPA